jgi:hypothetical protein
MGQSKNWGLPRYGALLLVLAAHMVLLLIFMRASEQTSAPQNQPIELLYLQSPKQPAIRAEVSRPKRLTADTVLSIVPPVFDSIDPSLLPSASLSDGNGQGVDWKAEARRAVQAFEIRTRAPPDYDGLSGSPAEEHWWPRTQHRPGMPFKTASGDWIVWINDNCYQVASSATHAFALGALLPPTVCTSLPEVARGTELRTTN